MNVLPGWRVEGANIPECGEQRCHRGKRIEAEAFYCVHRGNIFGHKTHFTGVSLAIKPVKSPGDFRLLRFDNTNFMFKAHQLAPQPMTMTTQPRHRIGAIDGALEPNRVTIGSVVRADVVEDELDAIHVLGTPSYRVGLVAMTPLILIQRFDGVVGSSDEPLLGEEERLQNPVIAMH